MGVTFNSKPFRNIPYFPAHIPLKERFHDLVFDISHMYYFSSGHCFSEALESPSLHTETSLNDVSGLKSGFGFYIFVTPQLDNMVHDRSHQHSGNVVHVPPQQCELP